MRKIKFILVLLIIYVVYSAWFTLENTLSSGDWPYLFLENIKEFSFPPQATPLWIVPYYQITAKIFVEFLGIHWHLVERWFWFWSFLAISITSSFYLTRSWLGVLIYTTNSYILMLVGGGQMGVALAYSLAPVVIKMFLDLIDHSFQNRQNFKLSGLTGLILALEFMFDPRIAYICLLGVFVYALFHFRNISYTAINLLIPLVIALFLNLFWIIPLLQVGTSALGENFNSVEGLVFFSFANFSDAFSLLHPNWPENVFGKVYFMRPEFLVLPILSFSSLLFLKGPKSKVILYFAFLGILGAFLSKGIHEPFGEINQLLFQYVPGMDSFRDPTKFYLLTILSYCVLIPFSLEAISGWIKDRKIIGVIFIIYWLFLIKPAVTQDLSGTFKPTIVPREYVTLKDFLKQNTNSTSFWIPKKQRFGFSSQNHVAIGSEELFGVSEASSISAFLNEEILLQKLKKEKIKYIVVPLDTHKELFILDRKYSEKIRNDLEQKLSKMSTLKRLSEFKEISVYMVQSD